MSSSRVSTRAELTQEQDEFSRRLLRLQDEHLLNLTLLDEHSTQHMQQACEQSQETYDHVMLFVVVQGHSHLNHELKRSLLEELKGLVAKLQTPGR